MSGKSEPHADTPPLGDKAAGLLLSLWQDSYRQEITAEEDVHRTLPFFAIALGLIIAAINFAAAQIPGWDRIVRACPRGRGQFFNHHLLACDWPDVAACVLLALGALIAVGVLLFLAAATKRRGYRRVGPERIHLQRAQLLRVFYAGHGLAGAELDCSVAADLRQQILDDFVAVVPHNRDITLRRYRLRAEAVSWLLWSLLCALIATILALVASKS